MEKKRCVALTLGLIASAAPEGMEVFGNDDDNDDDDGAMLGDDIDQQHDDGPDDDEPHTDKFTGLP